MATILMTWELGGGLSHLVPIRVIGARLIAEGHRVIAAVRDLQHARTVLGPSNIPLLQAPFKQRLTPGVENDIVSFAHILRNVAFGDVGELATLAQAWRQLFEMVNPDVVFFDHSPTALLASRGLRCHKILVGVGFVNPPGQSPLPNLRPWLKTDPAKLALDEAGILANANSVLKESGLTPMAELASLYAPVEGIYLNTLPVLDPYAPRGDASYLGPMVIPGGELPQWSDTPGRRIFAYLKPFAALKPLLSALRDLKQPTLIVAPDVHPKAKAHFTSSSLRFTDGFVNLTLAAAQCDLAILNGSNAAAAIMLQAGKPALHIPLVLEQVYNARAIERLGAGLGSAPDNPTEITGRLKDLVESSSYFIRAREAAESVPGIRPLQTVVDHVAALIP